MKTFWFFPLHATLISNNPFAKDRFLTQFQGYKISSIHLHTIACSHESARVVTGKRLEI